MLKDKEVVSDPQQQYEIARQMHLEQHAGINKTTAAIAVKYHWVRIKETVSRVIRDCSHCKDTLKVPSPNTATTSTSDAMNTDSDEESSKPESLDRMPRPEPMTTQPLIPHTHTPMQHHQNPFGAPNSSILQGHVGSLSDYAVPLDPQIMNLNHIPRYQTHDAMADPYGHVHNLHESNVRQHVTPNEYRMMVDDSDTDANALHQGIDLVHPQPNDVQMMKYQYVAHDQDELDFT
jgi:hypothetical protein